MLIAMLALVGVGALYLFLRQLNTSQFLLQRDRNTATALAEAKDTLIGYAISPASVASYGYLPLPDLGFTGAGPVIAEGEVPANFAGNNKDYSVIGKVPWKKLAAKPFRDGGGECLWYVVSGRFKSNPETDALNWDTQGQIDIIDGSGNIVASNLAALVISPGRPLDGQGHELADTAYAQCDGNYDARNYLDAYNIANAISGEVNYFSGSTNNRVASNSNNKRFVMTGNNSYNDRFLFIRSEDIFQPLIKRSDFGTAVSNMLDSLIPLVQSMPPSDIQGAKGTDLLKCDGFAEPTKTFCKNWKEMLFLTQLPAPSPVTIDGLPSPACNRVLIFAGQRTGTQIRASAGDKLNKVNYLEGSNLAAFDTPIAHSAAFSGPSVFSAASSGADILRCLP